MSRPSPRALTTSAAAVALSLLAACGSGSGGSSAPAPSASGGAGAGAAAGSKIEVLTSFYPVQFLTEQVGGEHVQVTSLTKPGAEPHDVELTPQDLATLSKANLLIYAKGFQPAVDSAAAKNSPKALLDLAPAANLTLEAGHSHEHKEGDGHNHGTSTAEPKKDDHGGKDPHFWLDPQRYAKVASSVADELSKIDPTHAADYAKNAKALQDKLSALDTEFTTALKSCSNKELVTSHAAFGYLAQRYGLEQEAIALNPEAEPSPAKLAEVSAFVKKHQVSTIYAETLVEPKFAEAVAKASGAKMATLDPIEGVTDKSAGKDYLEIMRSNLTALKAGQSCQ